MNSLHITLTEFRNESRLIKEAESLVSHDVFQRVKIIALGSEDLPEHEDVAPQVSVSRVRLKTKNLPKNLFFHGIKFIEFLIRVAYEARSIRPTVVSVHTFSLLPVGWIVKVACGSRLIYDTHELETEVSGLYGVSKKIAKLLEKCFIRTCSLVFVVSESIADWYEHEYSIVRPIVVMNAPRRIAYNQTSTLRDRFGIRDDQAVLLYQGGLMRDRGIVPVIEAMKARFDDRVVMVFMGYGELLPEVIEASKQCERILYQPAVAPADVMYWTASADVGISLIEPKSLSYLYCMPNKLFEYAMAGLPVLVSQTKDMANFVTEWNFGLVLSDMSPEEINSAIDSLISNNEFDVYRKNAYLAAVKNSWEVQEEKMLEGYRSIGFIS